ncbi:hypothetical protein EMCRGX_G000223 [Ephydatia muelleri]
MRSSGAHPIAITAWTSVVFAAIGCAIAVVGPTLLDLAGQLSVDNDVLASIFPVRAVGGFIGTAASGFVFDRFQGRSYMILTTFILLTVIVVSLIPLSIHTAMLGVVMFFFGFCMQGFVINGAQSILLKATQRLRRSSSYILFLHFSYAVGATLSPLWARFFVSKETLQTPSNLTCADALLLPLTTDNPVCSLALNATCPHNSSNVSLSDLEKYLCVSSPHPSLLFGWAYWLCVPIFLTALGAFVYYWIKYEPIGCRRTCSEFPSRGQEGLSTTSVPHKQTGTAYFLSSQPLHIKIIFFLLLSLFCYIYTGIEAFFTNYLFTFSVESGTFAKDTAAILNSLFWATFAVFRFIAILLALMKFPTALQIVANISGGLITSIILAIFPREAGVVWGAAALIGVCMSSTFPSIVAWLAQQTEMNGKVSALLICMGTLADMTMPLTVATLMTRVTPLSFVYFTVVEYAASLSLVAILFVFTWSRKRLWMKQQGGNHVGWKGEEEIQLTEAALSDEEEERGEGREEKALAHTQLPTSDSSDGRIHKEKSLELSTQL